MMTHTFYGIETATAKPCDLRNPKLQSVQDLFAILLHCWSAETCAPRLRQEWSPENPTKGQCSITAFLVQDLFGGQVYGIPLEDGNFHCYNVVGENLFDLTSEQFGERAKTLVYEQTPEQSRAVHFAKEEKRLRYELLKERIAVYLAE